MERRTMKATKWRFLTTMVSNRRMQCAKNANAEMETRHSARFFTVASLKWTDYRTVKSILSHQGNAVQVAVSESNYFQSNYIHTYIHTYMQITLHGHLSDGQVCWVNCHELGLAVRSYYDDIFLVKIPALRPPIVLVVVNYSYILVFLIDLVYS